MTKHKQTFKESISKWFDGWKISFSGIILASKFPIFIISSIIIFLFFGTLLNLLYTGTASFRLMAALDLGGKLKILADAFLATFGVGRNFLDWLSIFGISILQAILIGLLILSWRKKKEFPEIKASTKVDTSDSSNGAQTAGIAAGLAIIGSGCPTCGTTLLAPLVGAISSTGGYALASTLSQAVTIISVLIALLAIKKVGFDTYVIIIGNQYRQRKSGGKRNEKSSK